MITDQIFNFYLDNIFNIVFMKLPELFAMILGLCVVFARATMFWYILQNYINWYLRYLLFNWGLIGDLIINIYFFNEYLWLVFLAIKKNKKTNKYYL